MKKCLLLLGLPVLICALTAQAGVTGGNRVGINGSVSAGGDVEESQGGGGAQAEIAINRNFGIELAVDQFNDKSTDVDLEIKQDLTSIGLSAVFRGQFNQRFGGYFLIGVDYNMLNGDVTLDPGYYDNGWHATANLDDAFGAHIGGGLNAKLADHVELFLEYRYTGLDLTGDLTLSDGTYVYTESLEGTNDFGLFKLGINVLF